jgi:hypothetical protein
MQAVDLPGALGEIGIDPARQHRASLDVNYNNWLRARCASNCAPLKVF